MRTRNVEIVTLLLDKKAKINAVDFKGDTCLHIAMRARSKVFRLEYVDNKLNNYWLLCSNFF